MKSYVVCLVLSYFGLFLLLHIKLQCALIQLFGSSLVVLVQNQSLIFGN